MSVLEKLQLWYDQHCDGDWEHSYGVSIETMDNPGWMVKINLTDTLLENTSFSPIKYGDSEFACYNHSYSKGTSNEWIDCYRDEDFFYGYCSTGNLERVLSIFLEWANENSNTDEWNEKVSAMFELCNDEYFTKDNVSSVRKLYQDIEELPNEHPRKKELLRKFYHFWDKLSPEL